MVTLRDVLAARGRLGDLIYKTPLEVSLQLNSSDMKVFLKLECHQTVKSFKIRGALNKVASLSAAEKNRGIITVSSGNHGAGVAYAAKLLGGIPTQVFVPTITPASKIEKIKYYGAKVVMTGTDYNETQRGAEEFMQREKLTYIDPCSDVEVIAGQGTIALEILEQNPALDTIVVPIGGGGLITGIGVVMKELKPAVRVIGVQTKSCPAMIQSLQDGKWYGEYPIKPSICDALMGGVGEIPYKMAGRCIDDILPVEEESIREAVLWLLQKEKVVAEPSGAIGIAAIISNPEFFRGQNTAVIISGGNLDGSLMQDIVCPKG
jgi:threonine dehydratase